MPGTILIVDDVATNRIVLKVKLAHECYAVLQAATGREALGMVRGRRPDLVLLDVGLPDIDGISVLRAIRSDPAIADLPVLMFTAARDSDLRLTALQAGADGFLDKPLDDAVLVARIRSLLRDRARADETRAETRAIGLAEDAAGFAAQPHIALVAARPDTALRWRALLAPHVAGRLSVATRDEALALSAAPGGPDLYVIGGDAQGRVGGLGMLADLRSRAGSQHAAICVVLPEAGGERAAMAFDLGAGDVLGEGFDGAEAAARLRVLLARKRSADAQRAAVRAGLELAAVDPLTGLWNRRYA
ncbi:MAG: response regulator, partial [Gemmobacter sp.]